MLNLLGSLEAEYTANRQTVRALSCRGYLEYLGLRGGVRLLGHAPADGYGSARRRHLPERMQPVREGGLDLETETFSFEGAVGGLVEAVELGGAVGDVLLDFV